MNKANSIYRFIYIGLSVLAPLLIIVASTTIWNNRTICPSSNEVEKLRIEAENNQGRGFWRDSSQQEYETAKSCFNPDEENKAISDAIGASVMIAIAYGVLMYVTALLKKKVKLATKNQYEHLESLALWRFSKVLFWVIVPVAVTYMLLYESDYTNPLQGFGIGLGILSFPLYLLFKRLALYIASGKKETKD